MSIICYLKVLQYLLIYDSLRSNPDLFKSILLTLSWETEIMSILKEIIATFFSCYIPYRWIGWKNIIFKHDLGLVCFQLITTAKSDHGKNKLEHFRNTLRRLFSQTAKTSFQEKQEYSPQKFLLLKTRFTGIWFDFNNNRSTSASCRKSLFWDWCSSNLKVLWTAKISWESVWW